MKSGDKSEADNSKNKPIHFLAATFEDALDDMADQYGPNDHSAMDIRKERTVRKFLKRSGLENPYYGFKDVEGGFLIGKVGHMWSMMALLPLAPLLRKRFSTRQRTWADAILPGRLKDLDDVKRLGVLIKNTTSPLEGKELNHLKITSEQLDGFYDHVKAFAVKILKTTDEYRDHEPSDLRRRLEKVLAEPHTSPEKCAKKIGVEFGFLQDTPESASVEDEIVSREEPEVGEAGEHDGPWHYFEPTLDEFMRVDDFTPERDRDAEINEAIDKIDQAFRIEKTTTRPKIALLEGREQSGKKSIVGDFLRRVRKQTERDLLDKGKLKPGRDVPIALKIIYSHDFELELPIFVVSLRDHDYCSLAAHVYAFLLSVNDPSLRSRHANAQDHARALEAHAHELKLTHGRGGSPDKLIRLIEEEHKKRPILFGFLDAHGLDRDSLQRVLRHSGLYRLLVGLWESNRDSRYLITSAPFDRGNAPTELGFDRDAIKVPQPKFSRFAWCLRDAEQKRYLARGSGRSLADQLGECARSNRDPDVNGDVLLVLSAIYTLDGDREAFATLAQGYIAGRAKGGKGAELADAMVYANLVSTLASHGVLLPIALIAATRVTEDVLSSTSLDVLISKYFEQKGLDGTTAIAQMKIILDDLSTAVRKLFIAKTRSGHFDQEELGFDEEVASEPFNWFMSAAIGRGLLGAMLGNQDYAELARDALRLIATAARRRAQWKRIRRSEDASMEDRQDVARDIQAYVALLSSLPKRSEQQAAGNGKEPVAPAASLYRSIDRIFTIKDNFQRDTAYRFAVLCLLRQHIDHNYRLSMVTDQDELRLRLYLLAFLPAGKLYNLSIPELRKKKDIRKSLPIDPSVIKILKAKVYLELLLTVALAAYHAQAPNIVAWAWEVACKGVVADDSLDAETEAVLRARIACTVADAGILTGQHAIDTGNLARVHSWTSLQARPIIELLGGDPIDGTETNAADQLRKRELVKARMRIAAREAELSWIAGLSETGREAAAAIYARLEQLEDELADYNRQEAPVVLSGRTARRYARFQGNDFPLIVDPWFAGPIGSPASAQQRRNVLFIIQTNVLRLNEYAGADRIGVLLDQARRYCLRGKFKSALRFVDEAELRLDYSRISHGGKMEVFVVRAGISIMSAEVAARVGSYDEGDVKAADETIKRLLEIARDLKLLPAQASGKFLAARLAVLQNWGSGLPLHSQSVTELMDDATKDADQAGYVLLSSCVSRWREAIEAIRSQSDHDTVQAAK